MPKSERPLKQARVRTGLRPQWQRRGDKLPFPQFVPFLKHLRSYSLRYGGTGSDHALLAMNPPKLRECYGRRSQRR